MAYDIERFWSKVQRAGADDCWFWTAGTHKGYGTFWHEGKSLRANRVSLEMAEGPPPRVSDMALHSCDNPGCVNPKHLRWGSGQENVNDRLERTTDGKGENNPRATLTNELVAKIYRMRIEGFAIDEIAAAIGRPYTTIENVYVGAAWSHRLGVDGNPTLEELRRSTLNRKRVPSNKIITDEMADKIFSWRLDGETVKDIAKRLGLPTGTVSPVFCGLACTHRLGVDGNPTFEQLRAVRSIHPCNKLMPEDVDEIRRLLADGYTGKSIAKKYGVAPSLVSLIRNGKR